MLGTIRGAARATTDGAKFGLIFFIAITVFTVGLRIMQFAVRMVINSITKVAR